MEPWSPWSQWLEPVSQEQINENKEERHYMARIFCWLDYPFSCIAASRISADFRSPTPAKSCAPSSLRLIMASQTHVPHHENSVFHSNKAARIWKTLILDELLFWCAHLESGPRNWRFQATGAAGSWLPSTLALPCLGEGWFLEEHLAQGEVWKCLSQPFLCWCYPSQPAGCNLTEAGCISFSITHIVGME